MLNKILKILLVLDLVVVNSGLVYLVWLKIAPERRSSPLNFAQARGFAVRGEMKGDTVVKTEYVDKCGVDCQKYIDDKVSQLISLPVKQLSPTVTPVKGTAKAAPTKTKTRTVSYVTVPGSGSTKVNSWTDLTGTDFYFNKADYPGLVEVYFEVNMSLFNGNGMAYVQLFDVTHGVGVQGSDVQTASQTNSLVTSGQVTFWAGKNLIRVQARSLTADTAVYTSGRLRIVAEN